MARIAVRIIITVAVATAWALLTLLLPIAAAQ
jgi:hypothetical protein